VNIEQVLVELPDPLLRLVSLIKPDSASDQHWLKYVEVKDVKLSVEHHGLGSYSVLVTCEPILALKAKIACEAVMTDDVITYGDPNEIFQMVTGAVGALENDREQKSY